MRLLLAAFVAFTAHAQVSSFELRSLPSLGNARALLIAGDRARNTFILSASKPLTVTGRLRVTKLDPKGTQVAFYEFGDAVTDIPYAVTTDSDGNFVIVGGTKSRSFPIVSPLPRVASVNSPYIFTMAFISIVDASLTKLIFSATLAGTEPGPLCGIFTNTVGTAVAAMPDGKITVVGTTCAKDFPVTQNAFQKSGPGYDLFYTALSYAFVTTILPSAPSILYSTY